MSSPNDSLSIVAKEIKKKNCNKKDFKLQLYIYFSLLIGHGMSLSNQIKYNTKGHENTEKSSHTNKISIQQSNIFYVRARKTGNVEKEE